MFYPNSVPEDKKYRGIGGWLLLFCMSCFLIPIVFISGAFKTYTELKPYFYEYPNFYYATIFQYVYFGNFMFFKIITGIKLISEKPSAVNYAKKFLIVYAIGSLLSVLFPLVYGFSPDDTIILIFEQFKMAISACISSVIWFVYLKKSRRVKVTYGLP